MRKTTNIMKVLKGTDQKVRMDAEINLKPLPKLPPAPKLLSKYGRQVYRKLGNVLLVKNELNDHNIVGFTMFVAEFSMWYDIMLEFNNGTEEIIIEQVNKNGSEYKTINPKYRVARDAGDRAISLLKEFGFTTLSLTRVASMIKGNPDNNEYEQYLNS